MQNIGHADHIPPTYSAEDPTHFDYVDSEAENASLESEAWVDITPGEPAPPLLDEEGNCLGPTYAGVHIEDIHDAQVIIDAFVNGHLQAVCLHRLNRHQSSMLVASGNVIIYRGPKYQDGHSWSKRDRRQRDAFNLQIYSSATIKGLRKFLRRFNLTPDASYRLVSYQKTNETFPRASSVPQLLQFANRVDPTISVTAGAGEWAIGCDVAKDIPTSQTVFSCIADRPQQPEHTNCPPADTVNVIATVNPGSQHSSGDLYYHAADSSTCKQAEFVARPASKISLARSGSTVSEWMVINREGDHLSTTQATSAFRPSPQTSICTTEYFRAFVQSCPHLLNLPPQLTENRQYYLHCFFSRVAAIHTLPGSSCFAATETFALDYEGTPYVLAFLAVLREEFDIYITQQHVDATTKCHRELLVDFVFLPVSNQTSAPFTWLEIQTLGSNFKSERLKRAAWALGQLRPGSHARDSASFKWVRQIWSREPLRSGTRRVVDLLPGDATQEWPLLRRLKTRLYHPANCSLNSELVSLLDEDLRLACKQSLQEWCIALVHDLAQRPSDVQMLCHVYRAYMLRVAELQIDSFLQTGYTSVLHTCSRNPCDHALPQLHEIRLQLTATLGCLIESLVNSSLQGHFQLYPLPSNTHFQYATALGLHCYWLQVSYILLSPAERLLYDCLCRTTLNTLRAELAEKVGSPVLIWNYLPDDIQAWAAKRRQAWEASVL